MIVFSSADIQTSCESDRAADDPRSQGSRDLQRRLQVAKILYDQWTKVGSHVAGLAERFSDGSIMAVEDYIREAGFSLASMEIQSEQQGPQSVERRQAHELTYAAFVAEYMLPNKPVLIQGTNEGWLAAEQWVNLNGSINMDFLERQFGRGQVCIHASAEQNAGYGGGRRMHMSFCEYAERWNSGIAKAEGLYLKDWHFVNEFPDYKAYNCPHFFRDDWLNDYFDLRQSQASERSQQDTVTSDYRFVYLGPQGTFTPIHADVLRSFSWSTNLAGRKRWKLLAPENTALLMDRFGREMAPFFDTTDSQSRFPNISKAAALVIELEQGINEALFVPSGWHHSVENLEDTLSINHNWLNGYNIHWSWELVQEEHKSAAEAIEDCRALCDKVEFENLVQRNTQANCSFNFFSMAHFLGTITLQHMQMLLEHPNAETHVHATSLKQSCNILRELKADLSLCYGGSSCGEARDIVLNQPAESIFAKLVSLQRLLDQILLPDPVVSFVVQILSDITRMSSLILEDHQNENRLGEERV